MKLIARQLQAIDVLGGDALSILLFGGSRSTKTFTALRAIAVRALAAAHSRHLVYRFRFNHVKASIIYDTWPKMMSLCFPEVPDGLNRSDWFFEFPNGAQVWFGGIDDKGRSEKILGNEYATIFGNEASQIPWESRNLVLTRLAQRVEYELDGKKGELRLKEYNDCNPPSKSHWLHLLYVQHRDPDTRRPLLDPKQYAMLQMNPEDNRENLPKEYIDTVLKKMSPRLRARFYEGKFADELPGALWAQETIDKWRSISGEKLPEMVRIIIAVDPSGADDDDDTSNTLHDDIGIMVGGLGIDGNAYLLEDLTVNAGPKTWGNLIVQAFDNQEADAVVGETNFGGAMVKYVVQSQKGGRSIPFKMLNASRGKHVRAEPISALHESGKIRFAGVFPELEEELCAFTTHGYTGTRSPNRADAFVWLMTELFPGIVRKEVKDARAAARAPVRHHEYAPHPQSWMRT